VPNSYDLEFLKYENENGPNSFSVDSCRISSTTNYAKNLPQLFPMWFNQNSP